MRLPFTPNTSNGNNTISYFNEDKEQTSVFDLTVHISHSDEVFGNENFGITVWYFDAGIFDAGSLLIYKCYMVGITWLNPLCALKN